MTNNSNIRLMKKEETNFWDFENPQIQVKSHRTRVLVQRWWNVKIGSSVESVEKQGVETARAVNHKVNLEYRGKRSGRL